MWEYYLAHVAALDKEFLESMGAERWELATAVNGKLIFKRKKTARKKTVKNEG